MYTFCIGENYTERSIYGTNLGLLLSKLTDEASHSIFNKSTAGDSPDMVYALFLCRGDMNHQRCRDCIKSARQKLVEESCFQKEAVIYYNTCMLRYSNHTIFSIEAEAPGRYLESLYDVSNPYKFNEILGKKLDELTATAAASYGNSTVPYFATGKVSRADGFNNLYCLVQCTPDIAAYECERCLRVAIGFVQGCCLNKTMAIMVLPSCQVTYDTAPFFDLAAPPLLPPPLPPQTNPTKIDAKKAPFPISVTVIILVLVSVALALLTIWFCFLRKRHKGAPKARDELTLDTNNAESSFNFDFPTIKAATDNFSIANKLGQGGFGAVYKGKLQNGQEIAVKRLSTNSGQGDQEFMTEVLLLANLQHRNLVKLLGFCLQGDDRLLVYEFVPNTSLDRFLFDPKKRASLDWETRSKIIMGIARGLLYLHEDSRLKIVHRDLKTSNILLDAEMNPKIADFGVARLFEIDQTQDNTSRIVGTRGYMAPEYVLSGQFSIKSDVFSFGVIVLEIISGQKNSCFHRAGGVEDLLHYGWKVWNEGTSLDMIDDTGTTNFSRSEATRLIHISLLCVQEDAASRPTMASVVLMLKASSITLPFPSPPAFYSSTLQTRTITTF